MLNLTKTKIFLCAVLTSTALTCGSVYTAQAYDNYDNYDDYGMEDSYSAGNSGARVGGFVGLWLVDETDDKFKPGLFGGAEGSYELQDGISASLQIGYKQKSYSGSVIKRRSIVSSSITIGEKEQITGVGANEISGALTVNFEPIENASVWLSLEGAYVMLGGTLKDQTTEANTATLSSSVISSYLNLGAEYSISINNQMSITPSLSVGYGYRTNMNGLTVTSVTATPPVGMAVNKYCNVASTAPTGTGLTAIDKYTSSSNGFDDAAITAAANDAAKSNAIYCYAFANFMEGEFFKSDKKLINLDNLDATVKLAFNFAQKGLDAGAYILGNVYNLSSGFKVDAGLGINVGYTMNQFDISLKIEGILTDFATGFPNLSKYKAKAELSLGYTI